TELSAAAKLLEFREATGLLKDTSFDTISATGAHGASPHYHCTEESNAAIEVGQLFLIDSGGQYADGTMGGQIDAFARRPLWEAGLDFAHGTGHGVGAYLSVHEGPQRIAAPNYPGGGPAEPLRAGMFLSNEPGYYKAGEFGIRIENLVLVVEKDIPGAESVMLGFETLTFCPIERTLIEPALLTAPELAWLNAYHAQVLDVLGPEMDGEDRVWLKAKCAPIG
ncbi:MAG: M24 family metallopeptidase, partial [Hyphomicrobiales bacterium]